MKKTSLFVTFILVLLMSIILIDGCKVDKNKSLRKVLGNLEQIKSATYYHTLDAYMPGDTIPYGTGQVYLKEYSNLSDSSVGASYLKYTEDDTLKITYGYDGINQAWIDWDKKTVINDDFRNNLHPFRVVMAPFMTYAKTIIKYALEKKDSIKIDKIDFGDSVQYSISFYDQYLEFVGKIPVPVYDIPILPDGSAKGKVCRYDIWVNKSNNLPYKIKRDMIQNISVQVIKDIKINNLIIKDLKVSDYFPPDFPMLIRANQKLKKIDLEGKKAPDWSLKDFNSGTFALKNLKSKVIMIQFTGIGCGPCLSSIPFLKQLVTEYGSQDFDFISIEAWSKEDEIIKNHYNRHSLNFKYLISTEEITNSYQVTMIPTFFILDKNRVIRKIFRGYKKDVTDKELRDVINKLI
jgi:thiol-disulfide isomerase/thioredoxin